jgi:two-component system, OmpR family, sensor histidine kinase KdpD
MIPNDSQIGEPALSFREVFASGLSRTPPVLPTVLGLAVLALSTWLSFHFHQSFVITAFLYLVFVVLVALYGGFWQGSLVSIAAAASLNYFFEPPIFSFENNAQDWIALGAFEFTALVISRLSLRAQMQANQALSREREMQRLYETSRRILLMDGSRDLGYQIVSLIRETFEVSGVRLFDALSPTTCQLGLNPEGSERRTRQAHLLDADSFDARTRSWYCVLRLGARPVGGLALHHTGMSKLAATALASLCGIALERVRVMQRESHAEAARQTEQLRTAVLDALAHQFKTPLSIVRTASSGLLAIGGLPELQTDLLTSIDQQAARLDHLASRLLLAARLDAAEYMPRRETLPYSRIVGLALSKLAQPERNRFRVSVPSPEVPILADPELILTSILQLAENAIQYSEPDSPILVTFSVSDGRVIIKMLSKGPVVAPKERERIFERFYRAPETRHGPAGTGLGLSIVKKIVEAHQGSVWAEGEPNYGTSFSISLPAAPHA